MTTRSAKTGAGSISIVKQKQWVDAYMAAHPDATRNGAKKEYLKYRVERAHDFTARVAKLMVDGKVLVNRASVSKVGAIRGVSFMTPRDTSTIRVAKAANEFGASLGLTEEQVAEIVRKAKAVKKEEADAVTDVAATEVKAETAGQAVGAAA
jgi:hypothetical protein